MGDDYRRKIECEMDRFEAEISSLSRPPQPSQTTAFIPAQLRRQHVPPPPPHIGGNAGIIAAPPQITRPPQTTISGAPQVYRPPSMRPRIPIPQSGTMIQRGMRPPPSTTSMICAPPQVTFTARPMISAPPVITGLPVPASGQPGFVPMTTTASGSSSGTNNATPIVAPPVPALPPSISSIPLPTEPPVSSSEPKPSTSSTTVGVGGDGNKEGGKKKKKKKDKKPKKLIRCAGGTAWEDQSLQDWDPSDFRLFCGDLGNDVTDEVLTRVFTRYPSFQKARVIRDKRTNKTKGYGFVSFKDPNDFVRAVKELDGRYVGSRPIKLRKSNWKNRNLDVVRKREVERMQLLGINKKPKLF